MRDAVIVMGRELGISNRELAEALGIDGSSVTKRVEVARSRSTESDELRQLRKGIRKKAINKSQGTQA